MNPYYELPNMGKSFSRRDHGVSELQDGPVDALVSVGALSVVNGVESIVRRTLAALSRRHRRRIAIRELNGLSDRSLADIGLHRSQIASTVEEIIETGAQPSRRRARSWHVKAPSTTQAPANDNHDQPLFGGETAARIALLQR